MTSTSTCEFCGKLLEPRETILCGKKLTFGFKPCECEGSLKEVSRRESERVERNRRAEQEARIKRYSDAGIPMKFVRMEQSGDVERYIESGLYLWGKPGRGKTYLAALVAKQAIDAGIKTRFTSSKRMFDYLVDFAADGVDHFVSPQLLVIDDLGAEKPTEYKLEKLVQVIDERELAERPTIITSNLDLVVKAGECLAAQWASIGTVAASRLISRLSAYPKVFLDGVDRRLA